MKIFLSHSTADKWLARRIAADLAAISVQTFLDEKDIATGESIDSGIQTHLNDCADFLILLSPASIKSEWVLVELGGALALRKNVIPILLYLGPNDMPKPISKTKARDIADIEKYYDELKLKIPKTTPVAKVVVPKESKPKKPSPAMPFSIGDVVVLPKEQPEIAYRRRGAISWNDKMSQYRGLSAKVTAVNKANESVSIDLDAGDWTWANEWLVKKEG